MKSLILSLSITKKHNYKKTHKSFIPFKRKKLRKEIGIRLWKRIRIRIKMKRIRNIDLTIYILYATLNYPQ